MRDLDFLLLVMCLAIVYDDLRIWIWTWDTGYIWVWDD